MAVGDCAKHEYHGCKINHQSQKYHDICLWTSPREWIEDYGCHDPALEGLNIYDVMEKTLTIESGTICMAIIGDTLWTLQKGSIT